MNDGELFVGGQNPGSQRVNSFSASTESSNFSSGLGRPNVWYH